VVVGTAWTDQAAEGARGFQPREAPAVEQSLRRVLSEAPRGRTAVKVGMSATPATVAAIVRALQGFPGPVVFDPVLVASAGGSLFAGEPSQMRR